MNFDIDALVRKTGVAPTFNEAMENCGFRAAFAGVAGIAAGIAIGSFVGTLEGAHGDLQGTKFSEQVATGLKRSFAQTARRSVSMGVGFASVSVVYAGIECVLEKHRARHDIWNSVFGGAASGAIFGVLNNAKKSPMRILRGATMTAVGFAAFSVVVEEVTARINR